MTCQATETSSTHTVEDRVIGPLISVAFLGEVGESALHARQVGNLLFQGRDVGQGKLADLFTRSTCVSPKAEELLHVSPAEAEFPGAMTRLFRLSAV